MPHRPLVNLISWQVANWSDQKPARTLQFASISFDVSFQEMFSTWCSGGTLVLVPEEVRRHPPALLQYLTTGEIERVFLPVVALRYLAEAVQSNGRVPSQLREIITAGEQLEITEPVAALLKKLPQCQLHNHYGPSETHVVTAFTVSGWWAQPAQLPPIGRPICNVRVYILDAQRQIVPIGQVGELYIGGDALAREYLHRPDLTRERFIDDPVQPRNGHRVYRTGDFARWLPSGDIEFLGRRDDQVKIRGYRVELGEVKAVIEQHPKVREAVVLTEDSPRGSKQLVAFATPVPDQRLTTADIQKQFKAHLPSFMRPTRIAILNQLPLSPNGKIDRQALLRFRDQTHGHPQSDVGPCDSIELQLVQIWEEMLDRNRVGVTEDFFQAGGDSLLAMDLVARIERQFHRALPPSRLIHATTIRSLARLIRQHTVEKSWSPIVPLQPKGSLLPLFCIHPGGGNVLCYLPLARHLDNNQPVYALEAAGLDGVRPPACSVEEMAADYVSAVCRVQPSGPYALAGWSFGGTVAFEMAQQLQGQGAQVRLLAIIDAGFLYSFGVMRALFPEKDLGLYDLLRLPAPEQLSEFRRRTAVAHLIPTEANTALAERIYRIFLANVDAMMDYRPQPYSGRVTLLMGSEPFAKSRHSAYHEWQQLCPDVERFQVPGNHLTLMNEPHVVALAETLQTCLASRATFFSTNPARSDYNAGQGPLLEGPLLEMSPVCANHV